MHTGQIYILYIYILYIEVIQITSCSGICKTNIYIMIAINSYLFPNFKWIAILYLK